MSSYTIFGLTVGGWYCVVLHACLLDVCLDFLHHELIFDLPGRLHFHIHRNNREIRAFAVCKSSYRRTKNLKSISQSVGRSLCRHPEHHLVSSQWATCILEFWPSMIEFTASLPVSIQFYQDQTKTRHDRLEQWTAYAKLYATVLRCMRVVSKGRVEFCN